MKAIVSYTDGSQEIIENLTEVHYKFPFGRELVAFENNILQRGSTRRIGDIKELEIFDK
jgi:hypothetical protein